MRGLSGVICGTMIGAAIVAASVTGAERSKTKPAVSTIESDQAAEIRDLKAEIARQRTAHYELAREFARLRDWAHRADNKLEALCPSVPPEVDRGMMIPSHRSPATTNR